MATKRNLHIVPKVLMFALYVIQCSAPSYLSLIYQDRIGLKSTMIGVISSIPPFLCIFAGPGLSLVADMTGRPRLVLAVAIICTTATLWLFVLLPLTFGSACGVAVLYAITSAPIGSMMDVIALTILGDESVLYGQQRVWGSISCGITSFVGGMIVEKTGTINSIFVFHTVASAIFLTILTLVSKPWEEWGSGGKDSNSAKKEDGPDFVKPTILKSAQANEVYDPDTTAEELVLDDFGSKEGHTQEKPHGHSRSRRASIVDVARRASRQGSIVAAMGMIPDVIHVDDTGAGPSFGWLLAPDVLAFFVSNTLLGGVFSVIGSFLWIFLTNELEANATVRGMTGTAQVVLQLPFFFFAKQVMARLGVRKSITIAHVVTIIRFAAYPFLKPGPMVYVALGIEMLHGLAFSMNWTASVAFAAAVAPRGMEFMAQGILGAFYGGLGSGLGGIIGGFIYSAFGSKVLFYGCAAVTAFSLFIYIMVPARKIIKNHDNVPAGERIRDRQGSLKLLDVEAQAAAAAAAGMPIDDTDAALAARRPSAMAMAISHLGRRHSMIAV
ncbi:hypothetical protein PhCBS80983_g02891 [Powellomyces hirtus]|uniref:Major facilitator superfamily associated domain-containing protein n=1 Tax=Powellomyces hirtus TaxID=109895 RepID=A0A507E5Z4_9FUNG|nr:hypothetical protein PhCBS80983_g02891 [Powellomyces hirtus]